MPPPPKPATSPAAYSPPTGLPSDLQHPGGQVGFQPAEGLAGDDVQPHRDQRTGGRVEHLVRLGRAHPAVTEVLPGGADRDHLRILAQPGAHLAVPQPDDRLPPRRRRSAARRPARSSCRPVRRRSARSGSRRPCPGTPAPVGVILPPALVVSSSFTDFCAKSGFCSDPDRLNSGPMVLLSSRNQECVRPVDRMCRSAPERVEPGEQRASAAACRTRPATAGWARTGSGCRATSRPASG